MIASYPHWNNLSCKFLRSGNVQQHRLHLFREGQGKTCALLSFQNRNERYGGWVLTLCAKVKAVLFKKRKCRINKILLNFWSFFSPSTQDVPNSRRHATLHGLFSQSSRGLSLSKAQLMSLNFSRIIQVFPFYVLYVLSHNSLVAVKAQNWNWNKNTHYLPQWLLPQLSHIPLPWQQTHLCALFSPFLSHTSLPPPCCFWLISCRQFLVTFEKSHHPLRYLQPLRREGDSVRLLFSL